MSTPSTYADAHTPMIHSCWYIAGLVHEFSRELQQRFLLGKSVLMYLSTDGKPVLLQNRCAHRSFPLHHGRLEEDNVVCMYHGLKYNPLGACIHAPMIDRPAPHAKLHRYPTVVRGPLVWAWMGDPALANEAEIPATDWLADDGWVSGSGYVHVKANYVGLQENLLDLTHFSYLHAGNIGTPEWVNSPFEVTIEAKRVRVLRQLRNAPPPKIYAVAMGLTHRDKVHRVSDAWFQSPAMNVAYTHIEDVAAAADEKRKYHVNILHLITPETQHSMHYWAFISRDFALQDVGVSKWLTDSVMQAFNEDREALEWIDEMDTQEGRPAQVEASFSSDRGSLAMRKILQQLATSESA